MTEKEMVLERIEVLEKERADVEQELQRLHNRLKAEVDTGMGEGDPDLVERDRVISLIREHERQLESIDHALEQAQGGTYGVCERCHKPIDPARLEIVPDATLCVECKSALEQRKRFAR